MKKRFNLSILAALAVIVSGCSTFTTRQFDERLTESFDPKTGKIVERERTRISTKAGSRAFFDSDSQLTSFSATQTEKTQGAKVGALFQSAESTNGVEALKAIDSILSKVR